MSKVRGNKEAYWRRQFSQYESSGTSIADFCRRRGIPAHQFHWWKRKLSSLDAQDRACRVEVEDASAFIPVRLPVFSEGPIEVVHPGGCVIRVPAGFDADSLRRVLDTLSASRSKET